MKFLILMFLLTGCATGYVPSDKSSNGLGYTIKEIPEDSPVSFFTHTASYVGNARTQPVAAKVYTEFAALEQCHKENKTLVLLTDALNLSRTYRNQNVGITPNGAAYNYDSYSTLPAFLLGFRCDTQFKDFPQIITSFKSLKPELIKDYVNDFKGGVQLEGVKSSGVFESDDVLLKVNGQRVLNTLQVYGALAHTEGISTNVEYIRNKKVFKEDVLLKDRIESFTDINAQIIVKHCKELAQDPRFFDSCVKEVAERFSKYKK